jgi:hypothetical protein
MVVFHIDVDSQSDGGFGQLLIVVSWSNGPTTSQEEREYEQPDVM